MFHLIPQKIISILTFPGIILYNFFHVLVCKLKKIPIYKVCYFKFDNENKGYVIHNQAENINDEILIGIFPFILNNITGMLFGVPASILLLTERKVDIPIILLLWLSISIIINSFPSFSVISELSTLLKSKELTIPKLILIYPFLLFFKLSDSLKWAWFDLIYAIMIIILFPNLLIEILS